MSFYSPDIPTKRSYKRIPDLVIPQIPPLQSASTSASVPTTPITPISSTSRSSQARRRNPKRSRWQKVDAVLTSYGFDSLGDFLETVFYVHKGDDDDPRTPKHVAAVTSFLQGSSSIKMAHILQLIYAHPQSRPKIKYPDQVDAAFSSDKSLEEIRFARPCLNAWAVRTVGNELYRRIGRLVAKDKNPASQTHIRATTNGRKEGVRTMTWEDTNFTMHGLADRFREADALIWYITECLCAPRLKGKIVTRAHRPHPAVRCMI